MHFFDTLDIWTIKSTSPYYIYYKKRVFAFFENKKNSRFQCVHVSTS